ncbi:sensor histidine kinase [Streptomyces sp. N50]|uniref:sensor histidine kinase n=1 Tax=Streptomyces sp. N50 TaxID=3081765 RepID=UPI0029621952|nr:histidine kinase [Streptomyces sp. N50]WOX13620.1 histidine kinase [Streptomyces sp. N50]
MRMTQATGVASLSLTVLVTGSLTLLAVDVLAQPLSKGTLITGLILMILLPAVLLGQYAPPPYRLRYRWRWGLLGLQTLLTYLPVLVFEYSWLSLLGFLTGAVLLTVPRPASVVIATLVAASGPLLVNSSLVTTQSSGMSVLVSTVVTGSSVYAVVHLALLAARLQASHSQTARLAEHRERARITQDLHDLLGSSLVSIAVQSERALTHTPSATPGHQALGEIAALARRTHQEMRGITRHRVAAHLHTEIAHAQSLLSRAGIATRTTLPPRLDLAGPLAHCLSAVLREATGNVLQHSQASRCEIEVMTRASLLRLSIDNDGVPPGAEDLGPGSGLTNLRYRVLVLGGTLDTHSRDGHFVITAEFPLDPPMVLGDPNRIHDGARA